MLWLLAGEMVPVSCSTPNLLPTQEQLVLNWVWSWTTLRAGEVLLLPEFIVLVTVWVLIFVVMLADGQASEESLVSGCQKLIFFFHKWLGSLEEWFRIIPIPFNLRDQTDTSERVSVSLHADWQLSYTDVVKAFLPQVWIQQDQCMTAIPLMPPWTLELPPLLTFCTPTDKVVPSWITEQWEFWDIWISILTMVDSNLGASPEQQDVRINQWWNNY